MRIDSAIREVRRWTEKYDYIGNMEIGGSAAMLGKFIKFEARTTKTRASSMVSRIGLIVQGVVGDRTFRVDKSLVGDAPAERSSLATWSISVLFPARITARKGTPDHLRA